MPTIRFDISQAAEVAKYLEVSINRAAERALYAAALRVVQRILTVIIPKEKQPPVDRGAYRAGWKAKKIPKGAEVRNTLPYAAIIEYGARAENIKIGRAMIIALKGWVLRKGLGLPNGGSKWDRQKAAEQMAWAIAKAMQKRGIYGPEGLRVLEKALVGLEEDYAEELKTELEREYE